VRNLITDVPGVLVGNAQDRRAATGVTVALFEQSTVASVATLGGAPGSRAVSLLERQDRQSAGPDRGVGIAVSA
jgi:L-aminopeptidase/D-esterase-like protein